MRAVKRTWFTNDVKHVAYQVRYIGLDGKRKSFQKPTLREANQEIERVRDELKHAKSLGVVGSPDMTLGEAGDNWIKAAEIGRNDRPPCEAATLEQYETHLRLHIKPLWGQLKLRDLNLIKAREMRTELLTSGRSRSTCIKVWMSVKGIVSEAELQGHIIGNPTRPVRISKERAKEAKVVIPTPEEMKAILQAADNFARSNHDQVREGWRRWRPFIYTFALTGLRPSELRGLPWINTKATEIKVDQRADRYGTIGAPKSAAGFRTIAITDDLAKILEEWKTHCPKGDHDLVFPNMSGKVENLPNITNRCWDKLQKAAFGELRYNLYCVRHFRASVIIAAGWTPKEVQVEMGHSSIQVTFDTYGHLFEASGLKKQRAEKAQEWLTGPATPEQKHHKKTTKPSKRLKVGQENRTLTLVV